MSERHIRTAVKDRSRGLIQHRCRRLLYHDRLLIRDWLRGRVDLSLDTEVPLDAGPMLQRVADWLAPAHVEVRYPGVWLGEGIWATHGHTHRAGASIVTARVGTPSASSSSSSPGRRAAASADVALHVRIGLRASRR